MGLEEMGETEGILEVSDPKGRAVHQIGNKRLRSTQEELSKLFSGKCTKEERERLKVFDVPLNDPVYKCAIYMGIMTVFYHRECLRCSKRFVGEGPWNRICPLCKY